MVGVRHDVLVIGQAPALWLALIQALLRAADEARHARGRFRIALSGGTTPRPVYELLATQQGVDWSSFHVFFSDERCVPPDEPHSNYRLAHESILSRVAIPSQNVHRMRGELPPDQAARDYEAELGQEPLDLALLGMGTDGHTASLFPGDAALEERARLVAPSRAPVPPVQRLTLTLPALDRARLACFLICGADKALCLARVFAERDASKPDLVAARVAAPIEFYVDSAAAAALPEGLKSKARAV